MKIISSTGEIIKDTSEKVLRLKDLEPGDVFRYRRGHESNIYILGEGGVIFHLSGSRKYTINRLHMSSPVIWYPHADLILGEETVSGPDERRPEKDILDDIDVDDWRDHFDY